MLFYIQKLEKLKEDYGSLSDDLHVKNGKEVPEKLYYECPENWIQFKESCYLFEEKTYSFLEARTRCQYLDADLVHINDFAENDFLRQHLKTLKSIDFWIGLEDTAKEGIFKWVDDDTTPVFTGWYDHQPDNSGGNENCVHFRSTYNHNWNDEKCQAAFGSICEMKPKVSEIQNSCFNSQEKISEILVRLERIENKITNGVINTLVKTRTDCPDTWTRFKDSCYLFEEKTYSFFNARHHCQQFDADLVHINDFAENEFLRQHMKSLKSISFWIGLEDTAKEGSFKWVDDNTSPTYTDWHTGQPDNYKGNEDCAHINSLYNFNWNDAPCSLDYGPICEMKANK